MSAAARPLEVVIARMAIELIEGFHRALDVVARERKYLAFLEAPPLEKTREFIMNNMAKGYPQFVAIAGGDVVGWCDIIPKDRPIHIHSGILAIGLLLPFRGRGYGTALIEAALHEAHRLGLVRIELTVHADNRRAIALYERVGFKKEGTMRDAAFVDGQFRDMILMANIDRSHALFAVPATPR